MNGKKLHGMIVAPVTPVHRDGGLAVDAVKPMVDIMLAKGSEGVFAIGSTGNFPLFSVEERKTSAEAFVRAVDGRVPLCIHVGAANVDEVLDLARHAGKTGADAIASVPPYYFRYDAAALVAYFASVAAVNPDLPFYVYNIPSFSASDVTPAVMAQLAEKIPNLAGLKDTTQDFTRFMEYVDVGAGRFDSIMGSDAMCIAANNTGGAGAICAMATHNPELMAGIFRLWREGKTEEAGRLQMLASRLRLLFRKLPFYTPRAAIMRRRGISDTYHRVPMRDLTREEETILFSTLEKLEEEFSFPLLSKVSG